MSKVTYLLKIFCNSDSQTAQMCVACCILIGDLVSVTTSVDMSIYSVSCYIDMRKGGKYLAQRQEVWS